MLGLLAALCACFLFVHCWGNDDGPFPGLFGGNRLPVDTYGTLGIFERIGFFTLEGESRTIGTLAPLLDPDGNPIRNEKGEPMWRYTDLLTSRTVDLWSNAVVVNKNEETNSLVARVPSDTYGGPAGQLDVLAQRPIGSTNSDDITVGVIGDASSQKAGFLIRKGGDGQTYTVVLEDGSSFGPLHREVVEKGVSDKFVDSAGATKLLVARKFTGDQPWRFTSYKPAPPINEGDRAPEGDVGGGEVAFTRPGMYDNRDIADPFGE